ncbi:MAG: lysophospholipid acyltransferase family protein [Bacteriovorax sp.]
MNRIKLLVHIIVAKYLVKNFLRWIIGVQFDQGKKMAAFDQCIYVANHNSHLDTACFLSLIPANRFLVTHPVAAKDYFSKYAIVEMLIKFFVNAILIERKAKNGEDPLKLVHDSINEGHSILFFPEGSRGRPEVLGEFKMGIALLLKAHPHVPFVPIYMKGLGMAMPKGDPLIIPHESQILIGEPTIIADIEKFSNAEVAQMVRESILKLSAK